jgi:hypothetical protein
MNDQLVSADTSHCTRRLGPIGRPGRGDEQKYPFPRFGPAVCIGAREGVNPLKPKKEEDKIQRGNQGVK